MQITLSKNVIYLNSSQDLPAFLQGMQGIRWHFAKDPAEFRQLLGRIQGEVYVIVRAQFLGVRTVETLASWAQSHSRLSFIFIVQTVDKAAYQVALNEPHWLFVYESEGNIAEVISRRISGATVKSRRQQRVEVKAPVMLKKSITTERSPTGGNVQVLKEGEMNDFSKGGAKISLEACGIRVKDFVSLMYRNKQGRWVSVESQVRWVVSTTSGQQIMGVQFLAVSA